jgi:hypothetical protein
MRYVQVALLKAGEQPVVHTKLENNDGTVMIQS